MGKKSKRRTGPRETSAARKATNQHFRELLQTGLPPGNWAPPEFVPFPHAGEGVGKGRSYDVNEISPWKRYCANCYAGVVTYSDDSSGGTFLSTPKYECSNCHMAWYCNEECQSEHWKWHKLKCKQSIGTKEERKRMKRQARQWEKENYDLLKEERKKVQFQMKKIEEQRIFVEQVTQARAAQGQDPEPESSGGPFFQDYISSDEDE